MQFRVIATDNGKHSDQKLADALADDIVDRGTNAAAQSPELRRLANKIGDTVAKHFRAVADREHEAIAAKGHEHLMSSLEAHPDSVDAIAADVEAVVKASPQAAQIDNPDVAANIRHAAAKWVRYSQHMHRDWFARHGKVGHGADLTNAPGYDPSHEHVRAWKDLHDAPTPEGYRQALHAHAMAAQAK